MQKKFLTKEQALQKAKQYCAYQERCHYEVQQKLWDLGVWKSEHDEIISALIEEDYLNEERFAMLYAGSKFRMKGWGRKKILYALKEKKLSDYLVKKALKEINEDLYEETLYKLAREKYKALKGEQYLVRKKKATDYLLQKGYEPELINAALNKITAKE